MHEPELYLEMARQWLALARIVRRLEADAHDQTARDASAAGWGSGRAAER